MFTKVADVMTENVTALRASTPFKDIAASLREQRASAFPVIDDNGKVIGVVSEADLMPKEALEAGFETHTGLAGLLHRAELGKARGETAASLMSWPPITVRPFDFLSYAAHIMYEHRIRCLPVVGKDGRLAGMISRADVLNVFSRPDADLHREITGKVIYGEFCTNPAAFTVTVTDGIVTLAGTPESTSLGHQIVDAVRHMEGVVAVHDRLSYPRVQNASS
jgi:CBS-domain-containing membrane protein